MLVRNCDFCGKPAEVDTKTLYGYWAYLCTECNKVHGVKAFQTKLADLSEGGKPIIKLSGAMVEIPIEKEDIYEDYYL